MLRFYNIVGTVLLVLLLLAHFRGWSFLDHQRNPNVPRSVRDNPGSYRSVYVGTSHYGGGK